MKDIVEYHVSTLFQHESLAVIISVTRAKINEDAAEKAAASRDSSCSSLGISRANRLLHTLVVRMLDRDKVTLTTAHAICIQKRKKPLHQSSNSDSYLLTTFFKPLQF